MLPVKLTLFEGGYCHQLEALAMRGGQWRVCQFASIFGLIEHPNYGYILYDTGYSDRFHEETRHFPFKLYALTTPITISQEATAKSQLAMRNIAAEDINYIFISHFHADHISGLKDFPNAKLICFKTAYEAVRNKRGFQACKRGFIPRLLPDDFLLRVIFVDEQPTVGLSEEYYPFTIGHDIFRDGSLLAIDLPGHAIGQMGLLLSTPDNGKFFLIADACCFSKSYREYRPSHPITRIIHSDYKSYQKTLFNLHQLYQNNSEIKIIPSHCSEVREQIQARGSNE